MRRCALALLLVLATSVCGCPQLLSWFAAQFASEKVGAMDEGL